MVDAFNYRMEERAKERLTDLFHVKPRTAPREAFAVGALAAWSTAPTVSAAEEWAAFGEQAIVENYRGAQVPRAPDDPTKPFSFFQASSARSVAVIEKQARRGMVWAETFLHDVRDLYVAHGYSKVPADAVGRRCGRGLVGCAARSVTNETFCGTPSWSNVTERLAACDWDLEAGVAAKNRRVRHTMQAGSVLATLKMCWP